MSEPQIIRTDSGEELVVMSRREYDALLSALAEAEEELADVAALDQRMAEMAASIPHLPPDVSALLLQGKRRLTVIRAWRGMSPDDLALKAGVGRAEIDAIESGASPGTPASIASLAVALEVPPEWLTP